MSRVVFPTMDQLARLENPAWEIQPWDTPRGYGYFTDYYLILPKEKRSLAGAYRLFLERSGTKVAKKIDLAPRNWRSFADGSDHAGNRPPGSVHEHSLTWAQRALLRDIHVEKQAQIALEQEIIDLKRKEIELGKLLLDRARQMLATPLHKREVQDNGRLIIVEPTQWGEGDISRTAETGSKLARRGFELDTEKIAVSDWREKLIQSGIDPQQFLHRVVASLAAADKAGSGSDPK